MLRSVTEIIMHTMSDVMCVGIAARPFLKRFSPGF